MDEKSEVSRRRFGQDMRILPILFGTETDMVSAILDGRKTVTRRVIKKLPKDAEFCGLVLDSMLQEDKKDIGKCGFKTMQPTHKAGYIFKAPPYESGDILYVRETWCWLPCWVCGKDTTQDCCDETKNRFYNADRKEYGCYIYKAQFEENIHPTAWHPSIYMPKEAARIFLKVTNVRVERIQDITIEEIKKEGLPPCWTYYNFCEFWDKKVIKKSSPDQYGWDVNPWVWVIEFERCQKPVEES